MNNLLKYLLSAVAGLIFSITVPAQNTLTRLQDDKAIKKGSLGSGITYYIVENPVVKGRADAALVRRGEALSPKAGEDLAPFAGFLSRSGISPEPEGYIQRRGASTLFSFPSVSVHETAVLDSTLLMLFTLAGKSEADEAIIISGDVSAQAIKAKMDIFSLMLSRRNVGVRQDTHVWKSNPAPQWSFHEKTGGDRSRIRISYSAPRLPQNRLYTSQALVPELFAMQFEPFLRRRIGRSFNEAGIPYSELEFSYRGTAASAGDELYSVSIVTDTASTKPALARLAMILGEIDDFGAGTTEFGAIRSSMKPEMLERGAITPSDNAYLERCTAHFLYGTNLAPASTMVNLAVKRQLADSTWASLFNTYNRAWLGLLENLKLDIETGLDSLDTDEIIFTYNLNYLIGSTAGDTLSHNWASADSLLLEGDYPRVRLRETATEPVTGGETLYYSNGLRLVYKNMPSAEGFHYAVVWPGGIDSVDGIKSGEGAYIGELFRMFDVAGMESGDFRDMLAAAGISMDASIDIKNLVVKGRAPSGGLQLLLGSLLAITTDGMLSKGAFDTWRSNLALSRDSYMSQLTSAMMPGYQYIPAPLKDAVSEDTFRKAGDYYRDRFSRMDEATIIIIGNVDEQALKRLMVRYAGGFKTNGGTTSKRNNRYKIQNTHFTISGEGAPGVHAIYHAEVPLSAANYYLSMVMQEWLSRALPQALASQGLAVDVQCAVLPWPSEQLIVNVDCVPMPAESLPPGVEVADASSWANLLDRTMRKLEMPSASALGVYKERVTKSTGSRMESAGGLVDMMLLRLAYGKNFVMNYKGNVSSVDVSRIQAMWTELVSGGSVKVVCPGKTNTEQ